MKSADLLTSLDTACRLLRDLARDRGVSGVELYVRGDGRVEIRFGNEKAMHADTEEGFGMPLPSEAIAEAVK